MWGAVQRGLVASRLDVDRKKLLDAVLRHYGDEIAGRFSPGVYRLATKVVPWGFNWLLNAASVKRFLPWGMTESLQDRLQLVGEVEWMKRLSKDATILLVPTHQSNIDSLLIGYIIYLMGLPAFSYGAGLNLFSNPAFSFFMSNLGAYTVDRQKSNPLYKAILKNYSTALLKEGIHSIFFPGGGRSRSGAIERQLKLGLLGTAIDAQTALLQRSDRRVYVVPMVLSYHFVLEAGGLIEDYLAESGKHRYLSVDEEGFQPWKIAQFFWQFFSSKNSLTVRVGKPLDVFGNLVDENGRSLGPNGTTIDPRAWLSTRGELGPQPTRDAEYTRELGAQIITRFHKENTVLSSHLVAFSLFESLRRRYPDLGLYRLLKLTSDQRSIPLSAFFEEARADYERVRALADRGELTLSQELLSRGVEDWVRKGALQLGYLNGAAVVRIGEGEASTEDMSLLYYYRNRLTGYGLAPPWPAGMGGENV